ncbi:unnamed protein product [Zymoseptoria tritici ST99CH_3D1]|nr:unnamed protein product [Zymoseptoria tritici ST99CH_3D1]
MATTTAQRTVTSDSIELADQLSVSHSRQTSTGSNVAFPSHSQSALPPTDEGYLAYIALAGAFVNNALIWGFALSFGVLQEHYTNNPPFNAAPGGIAAIGTTCTGLMYLTMPVFLSAFQRWPWTRKYSMWTGVPVSAIALVGASFAQTIPQLLVCQGILYGLAGNALVMPTINFINEWWIRRRGFAIGVAIAGDGFGGVVMPLILQALLERVGFRWTLRIVATIIVTLSLPLLFLMKPRLPISATYVSPRVDLSFLQSRLFWIFQLFNTIQALGYFLPVNYLPSIAEELGLSPTLGSLTVLLVNLGMIFGCLAVGSLVDRFDVTTVLLGVSTISGFTVFAILGLSIVTAPLFIFSIMYGLTAGTYSTHWGGMIRELQKKHDGTDANLVFGLFALGRGVGSIISGPLSESLVASGKIWHYSATSTYVKQQAGATNSNPSSSAVHRALELPEILSHILLQLDEPGLTESQFSTAIEDLFIFQRVSRNWNAVIQDTLKLRRIMLLEYDEETSSDRPYGARYLLDPDTPALNLHPMLPCIRMEEEKWSAYRMRTEKQLIFTMDRYPVGPLEEHHTGRWLSTCIKCTSDGRLPQHFGHEDTLEDSKVLPRRISVARRCAVSRSGSVLDKGF